MNKKFYEFKEGEQAPTWLAALSASCVSVAFFAWAYWLSLSTSFFWHTLHYFAIFGGGIFMGIAAQLISSMFEDGMIE